MNAGLTGWRPASVIRPRPWSTRSPLRPAPDPVRERDGRRGAGPAGPLGTLAERITDGVRLRRLAAHLDDLVERRITFRSTFLGPATNALVPDSVVTRAIAPSLAGDTTE